MSSLCLTKVLAVSPSSLIYPIISVGPLIHISPISPIGSSTSVLGSNILISLSGLGIPIESNSESIIAVQQQKPVTSDSPYPTKTFRSLPCSLKYFSVFIRPIHEFHLYLSIVNDRTNVEFIEKTSMKKQYVSLLAIILSVSGFFFSCHDKMNKNTGALQFDSIRVNETVHLFNDTAKPACNIIINFTYSDKSTDDMLKDSLNAYFISACFGDKYIGEKPEEVIKQYTENYVNEYRRDLEPMYAEDEKDKEDESTIGAWYSYYKGIESHVQLYEKDLLVYRIDYNEYTGGAHGIYMTTYLNMDLTLMRPLRLDDIFVGEYKDALTDLIWNQLMADNKVTTHEALEDMGYASTGDITPTENFYLSKEGVTFYYNVYDITPYAMGPVKVTVPFPMMEHLLGSNPILGELKD